jgi:hypothetical protein
LRYTLTVAFSPFTYRHLTRAGWSSERRINTVEIEAALRSQGFECYPAAREFLSRFGGIRTGSPYSFHFDAPLAASRTFAENVAMDSQEVGQPLCPVGEPDGGYATLLLSADGRMFGVFDDNRWLVGETPEAAIEALYCCELVQQNFVIGCDITPVYEFAEEQDHAVTGSLHASGRL